MVDPLTRAIDWDDDSITENTRATYPIDHIPDAITDGEAGHRAGRLLPHVRRHGRDAADLQAHARDGQLPLPLRVHGQGGRHGGGVKEPSPTFSTCFGAPFMPRDPVVYATMLRERLARRDVRCWLVNTGWSGGPYGVGERMSIAFTRRLLQAALDGELDDVQYTPHPVFKVLVPRVVPGHPGGGAGPAQHVAGPGRLDAAAAKLAAQFIANFRQYEGRVPAEVAAAGPLPSA